jgi:hypothetical protein
MSTTNSRERRERGGNAKIREDGGKIRDCPIYLGFYSPIKSFIEKFIDDLK